MTPDEHIQAAERLLTDLMKRYHWDNRNRWEFLVALGQLHASVAVAKMGRGDSVSVNIPSDEAAMQALAEAVDRDHVMMRALQRGTDYR